MQTDPLMIAVQYLRLQLRSRILAVRSADAQAGELLVGGVVAEQQLRDVAGQQVHGDEHHDADAQQHEDELDQSMHDILCHWRSPLDGRAAAAAR